VQLNLRHHNLFISSNTVSQVCLVCRGVMWATVNVVLTQWFLNGPISVFRIPADKFRLKVIVTVRNVTPVCEQS